MARAVYTRPDAPARLGIEVRRAMEEGDPSPEIGDFGRGAMPDAYAEPDAMAEPDVMTEPHGMEDQEMAEPLEDAAMAYEAMASDADAAGYAGVMDGEPPMDIYESSDLVAGIDGSPIESTAADFEPDL